MPGGKITPAKTYSTKSGTTGSVASKPIAMPSGMKGPKAISVPAFTKAVRDTDNPFKG